MVDKEKTDPVLGKEINTYLESLGCETPMINSKTKSPAEKIQAIEEKAQEIMSILGLSLEDDSLRRTPSRIAKMYVNELFYGLDYNNFPKIMTFDNKMSFDSMVVERHIKVYSVCEHHGIPIVGEAVIAYIPKDKVIGLSKLNRIVDFFSRRPQVQERLGEQIYYALSYILGTEDVAVLIRAEHFCVKMRGVQDVNSDTITTKLGGLFFGGSQRNEFFQAAKL